MRQSQAALPQTETRLDRHRAEFKINEGIGPLLAVEELDSEELAQVSASFFERVRERGESDIDGIYRAYIETLHDWGVMCPHPLPHRLYDGFHKASAPMPFDTSRWYSCSMCGAAVINR